MQVLDLVFSLTAPHQTQLLELCQFLRKFIDNPEMIIDYSLAYSAVAAEIQQMDQKMFIFTYSGKLKTERHVKKMIGKVTPSQEIVTEMRNSTEMTKAENSTPTT